MKKILVLLLGATLFVGCNPKKSSGSENSEEKVIHDIDKLIEDLPDPSAVAYTIKSINAEYIDSLINPLENYQKYKGNIDKMAVNMGVYAADVNYLACFGEKQRTMDYAMMCHTLGQDLGDSAIFESDLIAEIEASIGNEALLSGLLREMIVKTSVTFEEDHHLSMAGLALAGTFIEEMYHAVNIIENYHAAGLNKEEVKLKIQPLVQLVLDQEEPLLDLIKLLEDLPHDDSTREIMTHLSILDRLYQGELAVIQEKMNTDENYVLDRDNMLGIMLEIDRIRAEIIK